VIVKAIKSKATKQSGFVLIFTSARTKTKALDVCNTICPKQTLEKIICLLIFLKGRKTQNGFIG